MSSLPNENHKDFFSNARVSVVVPFYRNAEWLEEALNSVKNQTFSPYEVIVVDDGSAEDISTIIDTYTDVVFIRQNNQGPACARNRGIKEANGEIIAFLDSDDIWEPDKLRIQIQAMLQNDYKWSATGYTTFGTGKKIYILPHATKGLCWEYIYDSAKIATPTVCVYKDILEDEPFPAGARFGEDTYLWFRLANKYKLGVVDEPLTRVRIRDDSSYKNRIYWIKTRAILWERMEESDELLSPQRPLCRMAYRIAYKLYKNLVSDELSALQWIPLALSFSLFRIDELCLKLKGTI